MSEHYAKSIVTKSYVGYDGENDKNRALSQSVRVSGATRASRVVGMIAEPMQAGKDDYDNVSYFWFIPLTNNVKSLFVMMILFAVITVAQYFAAVAANSWSLKADCISMGVDALSYLGNIIGESARIPEQRIVTQLLFSLISLALLIGFNTQVTIEVSEIIWPPPDFEGEAEDVVAWIVILFAGFGLLFDFISLWSFWYHAKKDAELEFEAQKTKAVEDGKTTAQVKKPEVNMLTALLHVGADLLRSTTTFIEGIILLFIPADPEKSERIDAICGLIICLSVYAGSAYALYEWFFETKKWFLSLGSSSGTAAEVKKVDA